MEITSNLSFKGVLGDKYVRQITESTRRVPTSEIIESVKSKYMGYDTSKLYDIFDSFINGLCRATQEKTMFKEQIDRFSQEVPEQIDKAVRATRDRLMSSFNSAMESKINEIKEKNQTIAKLQKYEAMAKVKSIEELEIVMPETAISTAEEMKTHKDEAEESMLTYLLTGKGQEAALAQTERANTLIKAQNDGITNITEVADSLKDLSYSEPLFYLQYLMENALRKDKGSVILSPKIKEQIKLNIMGLLTPHCSNKFSNTTEKRVSESIDTNLEKLVKLHQTVSQAKQKLKEETPNAQKIIYNEKKCIIEAFDKDGKIINSIYPY